MGSFLPKNGAYFMSIYAMGMAYFVGIIGCCMVFFEAAERERVLKVHEYKLSMAMLNKQASRSKIKRQVV